ncbi:hypothetical protein BO70DRAFT_319599 [Aspergillus heteromorphus CBS 117.55]|uniref:Mus7/MMS22 family-domain-containing protein n=1 Tax=Aspergillus heteromorphus CBS 117.55 TaxID=1448321 RepID=A0A317VMD8_9EURO|nr:uncharacterized protein BO70DRAFT_319599 [Aspergillus heteromorphus CBS 117.55]PWY74401.1 hypothetical protein BO70DRAFT_319599 [Aspergillus heteromorphus CBS 117.55]
MESWRERGFVPDSDSDSEVGLDSQESRKLSEDVGDSTAAVAVAVEVVVGVEGERSSLDGRDEGEGQRQPDEDVQVHAHAPQDDNVDYNRPVTPSIPTQESVQPEQVEKIELQLPPVLPSNTADDGVGLDPPLLGLEPPEREVTPRAGENAVDSQMPKHSPEQMNDPSHGAADLDMPLSTLPEDGETPRAGTKTDDSRLHRAQSSEPMNAAADDATPRAEDNGTMWDMPSSEDELQWGHRLPKKPSHVYSRAKRDTQTQPQPQPQPQQQQQEEKEYEMDDVSSPSSPLSSVDSLRLGVTADVDESGQGGQKQPEEPTEDIMEQLLQTIDIPEEVLQEMSQPARRSLRERKAIQLHPYMLEDAKYRGLMRARGVKPVRAQYDLPPPAASESQNKGYVDGAEPISDSFGTDFQFPPSSPVEFCRLSEKRHFRGSPEHSRHGSPQLGESPRILTGRQSKRRKISKPQNDRPPQTQYPQPRVVIQNPSPKRSTAHVPSPPRSEENIISSPPMEPSNVFRFLPGFTPSSTTTNVEPEQTNAPQDVDSMDWSEADDGPEDIHMEGTQTEPNSEAEDAIEVDDNQDQDDAAVRRYQRRIKGVLPASWLRLDQRKQEERTSATQQRERVLARENAKGVAQKITKKNATSKASRSSAHLTSLRQLADSDSGDESEDRDSRGHDIKDNASRQLLAQFGIPEFDNEDVDIGLDIPEDNRIDYMFPPMPRGPSGPRAPKQAKKRPTFETDSVRSAGAPKRTRLKKQARITDHVYGTQKQKRPRPSAPRPSLPKLGILDAPDVASRPRNTQPQFLRIAARQARSRQDRGRRSPSRKVFNLSSHVDTEDANSSLREWRSGRLKQTQLPQPQPRPQAKPSRRQPLIALSTNRPAVFQRTRDRRVTEYMTDASPAPHHGEASEKTPNADAHDPDQTPKAVTHPMPTQQAKQRANNKWVVQRNLAISTLKRRDPRPAMLEVENPRGKPVSASSFQKSLSLLNRDYRRKRLPEVQRGNLVLDRFISSRSSTPTGAQHKDTSRPPKKPENSNDQTQPRRQLKKRPPKRLQITAVPDQIPVIELTDVTPQWQDMPTRTSVGALHGFQISYSIEFNIVPLYTGTYFHETTFLGSGEFSRSLDVLKRNLDADAGLLSIRVGDMGFRWGAWNDTVSSELGTVFDRMIEWFEKNDVDSTESPVESPEKHGGSLYRSVVKYVTNILSFIDPIDRTGFVTRAHSLVCKLCDALSMLVPKTEREMELFAAICSYNTVFTYQVLRVAEHELVDDALAKLVMESLDNASKQAIAVISSPLGQANIRRFLTDMDSSERRDAGIQRGQCAVEAYVTVRHVLRGVDKRLEGLLTETYSIPDKDIESTDVSRLEGVWPCIFTTLPLDEFDASGIARVGSRFWQGNGNWPVIKMLLRPVLESYDATSATQPVSYYKYCRALLHRCFHLITGWGWRDCKPILDTLYDFFARYTLYNLKQEESFKSPAFLDELDRNPSLEVQPGDPCFHILLKIIASGLRYLSKAYDKKKVRNFAWRLLPNHGRVYPKEKPIHQTDLDALRNHHDLLCTLYYAVPDGCRPRLETIKNLVHPASSHRETCNISLRSWGRLIRFKLSTDEDVSGLEAFADWHCYFVTELLKQHALARQEVEAQNTADNKFSDQLIERTIAQNQRQIESLLKTALNGLQSAVQSAPTVQHAQKLVSGAPVKALLTLFNPRVARVNTTVSETLQVIIAYINKCNLTPAAEEANAPVANAPLAVDEDSQEYGDWADIAAVYDESPPAPPEIVHVEEVFHPAVFRLISNCFGEDYCPEDAILLKVVDCWTSVAHTLVKHGLRHWDSYLSPYNGDSWTSLRLTIQTRKFTPLFLASCIEKDTKFTTECKVQTIGMWMSSLVERVSMLKFQHRLTEALLNQEGTEPLLQNLPFVREQKGYTITLEDLSHRRVSLISSLLANMRAHLQGLEDIGARELSSTKQEYREIIQNMMSAMKANYQELGSGAASAQGAYVDFVHRIVGFLQQHSRDICPIDSFFTDPASFPLPSGDPTYIVARLKSYEPKLSSEKVAKTLIIFIQSVSERAAVDGQQDYLVNQLHASIADTYESGLPEKPTLRATLLQAVFPAYLEASLSNPACWILSRPIIQTISLVLKDLLFNIDSTDPSCVASVLNIFTSVFQTSYTALSFITTDALTDPAVATTAASLLKMITSALPIIDYIDRATDLDERILSQLHTFHTFILSTTDPDSLSPEPFNADPIPSLPTITTFTTPPFFPDLRLSASRELRSYIAESWSRHQRKYYFTRRGGYQPQEIDIQPPVAAELKQPPDQVFGSAVTEFLDVVRGLDLLPSLSSDVDAQRGLEYGHGYGVDVLYTLDLCS